MQLGMTLPVITVSNQWFFKKKMLSHLEKDKSIYWVYILKLNYKLVHDLGRKEYSHAQEMGHKPDFNIN